jgi:hypothetical protein
MLQDRTVRALLEAHMKADLFQGVHFLVELVSNLEDSATASRSQLFDGLEGLRAPACLQEGPQLLIPFFEVEIFLINQQILIESDDLNTSLV